MTGGPLARGRIDALSVRVGRASVLAVLFLMANAKAASSVRAAGCRPDMTREASPLRAATFRHPRMLEIYIYIIMGQKGPHAGRVAIY